MRKLIITMLLGGLGSLSILSAAGCASSPKRINVSDAFPENSVVSTEKSEASETSEKSRADQSSREEESSEESAVIPADSIALNEMSVTLHPGEKYRLDAVLQPEDAGGKLTWLSSDDSIVTVTDDGRLKALSAGQVTITVTTENDLSSSCTITVYDGEYIEDSDEESEEESKNESEEESKDESEEESKDESEEESKDESKDESEEESKEESKEESSRTVTGEAVDASWFDDAVFIGDSVTYGLYNYAENGCLGDADFLAIDCMGYHTAMFGLDHEYGIHPVYNGQKVMIDDAVREIGKKKVFIMLGMNDICSWGVDESVDAMKEFTDGLLAKSPDIQIYVHSVTPMIAGKVREDFLNNTNIARYNEQIRQICAERGFIYLDLVPVVSDGNGNLRDDYCVDPNNLGFHYNSTGMQAWVDFLKTHVQ